MSRPEPRVPGFRPPRVGAAATGTLRTWAAVFHAVACVLGLTVLLTVYGTLGSYSVTAVYRAVTLAAMVNLAVTLYVSRGVWTASAAYIAVFSLFHFGLIAVLGAGLRSEGDLSWWNQSWVFSAAARRASVLALAGALACTLGAFIVRLAAGAMGRARPRVERGSTAPRGDPLARIGAVLLIACTLAWFAIVASSGGFLLLVSSYATYLEQTSAYAPLLALVWMGTGLGFVLVSMARSSRWRLVGILTYLLLSAFAIPLGLRGEIMFPAVAAGVARARVGRPFSTRLTVVGAVLVLLVIATVRELRQAGLAGSSVDAVEFASVTDALVELGGSLQPVQAVITWHDRGDDFALGATYWAPIDRALVYVIPGWTRVPAEEDDRIMNILVTKRVGPIGFSPVAEAYRNFGPFGVMCVMLVIGLLLGGLDRLKGTPEWQFAGMVLLVPLLTNVRNSFVSVPPQMALGGAVLILFLVLRPGRQAGIRRGGARGVGPRGPAPVRA